MPISFILSGQIISPSNEFDGIVSHTNRIRVCIHYLLILLHKKIIFCQLLILLIL
jgi:hypothetical protein